MSRRPFQPYIAKTRHDIVGTCSVYSSGENKSCPQERKPCPLSCWQVFATDINPTSGSGKQYIVLDHLPVTFCRSEAASCLSHRRTLFTTSAKSESRIVILMWLLRAGVGAIPTSTPRLEKTPARSS